MGTPHQKRGRFKEAGLFINNLRRFHQHGFWSRGERKNISGDLYFYPSRDTVLSGPDWTAVFDVHPKVKCAVFLLFYFRVAIERLELLAEVFMLCISLACHAKSKQKLSPGRSRTHKHRSHRPIHQSVPIFKSKSRSTYFSIHSITTNSRSSTMPQKISQQIRHRGAIHRNTFFQGSKYLESPRVIRRSHVDLVTPKLPAE